MHSHPFPAVLRQIALTLSLSMDAKPAYLSLVKTMREDEIVFLAHKAGQKWVSRDLVRLEKKLERDDPSLPDLSDAETQELASFAKTPAGDKILMREIHRQQPVLDTAWSEVRDLVETCNQALAGELRFTQCQSENVSNSDKSCSVRYRVMGRVGSDTRSTEVLQTCQMPRGTMGGMLLQLPGRHEVIGLAWRDTRQLEVLVPPGVKPDYRETDEKYSGVKIEYRTRGQGDPPALACVAQPSLNEFGWARE